MRMRPIARTARYAGLLAATLASGTATAAPALRGILSVVWADPRHPERLASGQALQRFELALPDGTTRSLRLTPALAAQAVTLAGQTVEVSIPGAMPEAAPTPLAATALRAVAGLPDRAASTTPGTPVTRRVLYILLKYAGTTQEPHAPKFFDALTNPLKASSGSNIPATLNQFFGDTSWNQLQWQADVLGSEGLNTSRHWLTLPKAKSGYANCGWSSSCANLTAIRTDALALVAAQGISITGYSNINFVLNDDLDCCAWGGGFSTGGKSYGATWEPPWGQETGTYAHEYGHSIGLPHSGWVYYAYDSPWDIMSDRSSSKDLLCGSYASTNDGGASSNLFCSEPGDGYIGAHKDFLGWIPAANEVTISAAGTTTVKLEALSLPLGTAAKLIKICLPGEACTGGTAHYLTVETRVPSAYVPTKYDNAVPAKGVIIHDVRRNRAAIGGTCFFNNQSGWAVPIDATPGDYDSTACNGGGRPYPFGLANAQFTTGMTYTNATAGVTVKVGRFSRNAFTVTVTRAN